MKKIFFPFSFLIFIFILTGCGKQVMMDQLDKQGFYPYSDAYLGFNLSLPREFQYYQFERDTFPAYTDLDIFVPTADADYPEKVAGYAEPIIVRIYDQAAYDNLSGAERASMVKVGEKNGKIYNMIFWAAAPKDWKDKWSDAMKRQLIKNFSLK
ncbi:MAG TPA: hypothetical protein VMC41_00585 [Candidatus Nanoarchaeia archaeon]|nr:hypothetical protein [Candidatus Nanoarchaeia archaeon]